MKVVGWKCPISKDVCMIFQSRIKKISSAILINLTKNSVFLRNSSTIITFLTRKIETILLSRLKLSIVYNWLRVVPSTREEIIAKSFEHWHFTSGETGYYLQNGKAECIGMQCNAMHCKQITCLFGFFAYLFSLRHSSMPGSKQDDTLWAVRWACWCGNCKRWSDLSLRLVEWTAWKPAHKMLLNWCLGNTTPD